MKTMQPTTTSRADAITNIQRTAMLVSGRISIVYDDKYFVTQNTFGDARDWVLWAARRARYANYWSHYEATIFEAFNTWSGSLKEAKALYQYIRSIYSPANRLGEFWATHVYGGPIDPAAGTGDLTPSAIPIITKNEAIRPALAKLWKDSNWQTHKETYGRFGAIFGDVGLYVEDDEQRQQVRLRVIDPRTIFDVDEDKQCNVRGYTFLEMRPDPRMDLNLQSGTVPAPYVAYQEIAERNGSQVIFETFLDGEPWPWSDTPRSTAMWFEDYGFVPMVRVKHRDIGLKWGASEFFSLTSKLYELDDQASKFGDYTRKAVDSPWLFAGVNAEDIQNSKNPRDKPDDQPGEGRARVPIIYCNDSNARAYPLIAPLSLADVLANIQSIMKVIEQEHPELTADLAMASGDASGRALRVAREKAEALVTQRRASYDDALVRAQKMAISIGAMKGYPGYEAFDAGSYARGDLEHSIGSRPVFALNQYDRLEQEKERSLIIKQFRDGGMPLETCMLRAGYSHAEVAAMKKARDEEMEYQLQQIQVRQAAAASDGASYGVNQ